MENDWMFLFVVFVVLLIVWAAAALWPGQQAGRIKSEIEAAERDTVELVRRLYGPKGSDQ